MKSCWA